MTAILTAIIGAFAVALPVWYTANYFGLSVAYLDTVFVLLVAKAVFHYVLPTEKEITIMLHDNKEGD